MQEPQNQVRRAIYLSLLMVTIAYAIAPASAVATSNYFAVVLAGLCSWLTWGQVPDSWSLAGSVLVILGGLLTLYQSREHAGTPGEP